MKKQWNSGSFSVANRKAHNEPIISIAPFDQKTFFTSSQDNTIRLWDIRNMSSVKLFRNAQLKNITNCDTDKIKNIYVGSEKHIVSFDIRTEKIFVEQITHKTQDQHFDDVNCIKVQGKLGIIGAGDDEGDIRLYNEELGCTDLLDQGHHNIVNSIQYVKTQKALYCITGGFDCRLLIWKVEDQSIFRQIDLQDLLKSMQIKATCLPFIHCVTKQNNDLFVSTQSGHVLSFPVKDIKKPKWILEASMSSISCVRKMSINENIMISSAKDGTFSLWDITKRYEGAPLFLQKYKCLQQPNWIESIGNILLISHDKDNALQFFTIK